MTEVVSCGFARVSLWKSKRLALGNLKRGANESLTKFKIRILDERYRLFNDNFNHYERMHLDKGKRYFLRQYYTVLSKPNIKINC